MPVSNGYDVSPTFTGELQPEGIDRDLSTLYPRTLDFSNFVVDLIVTIIIYSINVVKTSFSSIVYYNSGGIHDSMRIPDPPVARSLSTSPMIPEAWLDKERLETEAGMMDDSHFHLGLPLKLIYHRGCPQPTTSQISTSWYFSIY